MAPSLEVGGRSQPSQLIGDVGGTVAYVALPQFRLTRSPEGIPDHADPLEMPRLHLPLLETVTSLNRFTMDACASRLSLSDRHVGCSAGRAKNRY